MSDREVLELAGQPDLIAELGAMRRYVYLPTSGAPHTTLVTLVGGLVAELERKQRF